MILSKDFKCIYACYPTHIAKVYDLCSLKIINNLNHNLYLIITIYINSCSSLILSVNTDCHIILWTQVTMKLVYYLKAQTLKINSINFHPSSKNFVSASDDKTIKVFQTFADYLIFLC